MKKILLGFLIGLFFTVSVSLIAEIRLSSPITSSYQNVKVRRVIIAPDGNVYVAFKRADTGEAVLVNTPITDPITGVVTNQNVPEINFKAVSNVNTIISQVENYITSHNLVSGSVVP